MESNLNYLQDCLVEKWEAKMKRAKLSESVAQQFRYQQENCAAFHLHDRFAGATLHTYLIAMPQKGSHDCITPSTRQLAFGNPRFPTKSFSRFTGCIEATMHNTGLKEDNQEYTKPPLTSLS